MYRAAHISASDGSDYKRLTKRNRRQRGYERPGTFKEGKTMMTIETFIQRCNTRFLCLTLLSTAIAAAPLIGADAAATQETTQETAQAHAAHVAKPDRK